MNIQLLRHATLGLTYAGITILVDPMFSDAGANPPIVNSANDRRNPLVPLPDAASGWLAPNALLVTHLHRDHWDDAAAAAIAKETPVLCQPVDEAAFQAAGFADVTPVERTLQLRGITVTRTGGRHGTGEIGERMGPVSGFVLQAEGHPALYIAGDTIWCDEVAEALDAFRPAVTIVNAGGARFTVGDPITMNEDDVIQVCRYAPYTKVIAVHMDSINHCLVTRSDLRARLEAEGCLDRVSLPEDGAFVRI